ncbi:hypothetical protein [Sphingobacterium sp. LRF_L2]
MKNWKKEVLINQPTMMLEDQVITLASLNNFLEWDSLEPEAKCPIVTF